MNFSFSHEELSYLMKRFGYKQLVGVERVRFQDKACEASLLEKEYISPYKKGFELTNEVRLLLSTWVNIRYTLVSDRYIDDDNTFAIFANRDRIITYSYHGGEIKIAMGDFSVAVMDTVISDYLCIGAFDGCLSKFNISFNGDDYLSLFGEEVSNEMISQKTGLSTEDVASIKQTLNSEDCVSFVLQDVVEDIGCMGLLKQYPEGYVLVKHIVPNKKMDDQRVVVTKGNSQDIVDSIYIL